MAKIATDIKQSKLLVEILSADSADMHYNNASVRGVEYVDNYRLEPYCYTEAINADWALVYKNHNPLFKIIPAWSLSKLMESLPKDKNIETSLSFGCYDSDGNYKEEWICCYEQLNNIEDDMLEITTSNEAVDACVEMLVKLKKMDLL